MKYRTARSLAILLVALSAMLSAAPLFSLDVEKDIVQKARKCVGCQYLTGGTTPSQFDCSGFVGYIVRPYAKGLPRLSKDMSEFGTQIDKNDLRPGDLVFFATTENVGIVSHVALYIGDDAIIHSISDGPNRGVTITSLSARYWTTHYHNAVRVLPVAAQIKPDATPKPEVAPMPVITPKPEVAPMPVITPKPEVAPMPDAVAKPKEPSAWDTWDGYIAGDYGQWKAEQDRKYKEFKKAESSNGEASEYEAWKKANER